MLLMVSQKNWEVNTLAKFIRDWNDLVGLESEHYRLEIDVDMGNGYIVPKDDSVERHPYYLSTHTFYGSSCKGYEILLQKCGFNVEINNWDKECNK